MKPADDTSMLAKKRESSPTEFARWLASMGDLYWWEKGRFWVVTRWALADRVLRGAEFSADRGAFFVSRMPNLDLSLIEDFFSVVRKMMVMSDDQSHASRRGVAQKAMSDAAVTAFRAALERAVRSLVDALPDSGFEFVRDVAEPLPQTLLAELFAIPTEDRPAFYRWSWEMTQFFGGASAYRNEDGVRVNDCARALRVYFEQLLEARRAKPQNDVMSQMLALQGRVGLTDAEIVSQAIMMLVAGQVTTTDQLCNNLFTLLEAPDRWASLAEEPEGFAGALEEANRLDPAVTFLFRIVRTEVRLGNETLRPGDVVFVSNHCVGRDPSVFDAADAFVPKRPRNPHMAFGHGSHYCLGARLAREAMIACFTAMARRFPRLRFAETPVRKHPSLAFSGFERLAVAGDTLSSMKEVRRHDERPVASLV